MTLLTVICGTKFINNGGNESMGKALEKRNSAIELLRIVAMMGVVILHYNNKDIGGGFAYVQYGSMNYYLLYYLESVFIASVDVYILITGYFMCNRQARYLFRPFELLFQVCFFKMVLYVASVCAGQAFSMKTLVACIIPNNYFVVLYSALYLVSPLVNCAFAKMEKTVFRKTVIILLLIFSIWPMLADVLNEVMKKEYLGLSTIGMYGSQSGYTIVTFICLYVIGAYIRCCCTELPSKKKCAAVFVSLSFIEFIWSVSERAIFEKQYTAWHYNNIVVIGLAASAFCFFLQLKIEKEWLDKLAKAGFVCFLIHQPIMKYVGVRFFVQQNVPFMLMHITLSTLLIYIGSYIVYCIYMLTINIVLCKFKRFFPTIDIMAGL